MLAAFLTNAAMVSVATRFHCGRRFFDTCEIIAYTEIVDIVEKYKSSTLGIPETADPVAMNAFTLPLMSTSLCQQGINDHAEQSRQSIIESLQDYIIRSRRTLRQHQKS